MTVNKRSKNSRLRGSHTHGWGAKKKHRGSGHRGGVGMAGSGKRADTKKPSLWKERYFGKLGFVSKSKIVVIPINIWQIEEKLNKWVADKKIKKDNEVYEIDLEKLGYNKLLSEGVVKNKLKIKTPYASKNSVEKIKKAGGEIIGLG